MEIPVGPDPTWLCIGQQFIDASSSTALTVPAVPSGQRGYVEYGAILLAQAVKQWLRFDGVAPTADLLGAVGLEAGDFVVLRGRKNLDLVRVIRDATSGSLAVTYYTFRGTPN